MPKILRNFTQSFFAMQSKTHKGIERERERARDQGATRPTDSHDYDDDDDDDDDADALGHLLGFTGIARRP